MRLPWPPGTVCFYDYNYSFIGPQEGDRTWHASSTGSGSVAWLRTSYINFEKALYKMNMHVCTNEDHLIQNAWWFQNWWSLFEGHCN